jgi:cell division protein FtsB
MSDAQETVSDVPARGTSRRLPKTRQEIQNRRRRVLTYVVVISSTVLMVNALVGENGYLAMLRAHRDNAALSAQVLALHNDNLRLAEQADRLKHDPNAIEEVARRKLELLKPGEVMVVVHDPQSLAPAIR